LAFTLSGSAPDEPVLHVMLNMHTQPADFAIPATTGIRWTPAVDTGREPYVFDPIDHQEPVAGRYSLLERSLAVLEGRL
jgi:glycogen operon protein